MEALKKTDSPIDPLLLEQAFERFNEAGRRLEEKYAELLRETEGLRQELAEKDRAVKRAERLATLGQTAAGIAHEVRNPLGAIRLYVSLLKEDLKELPDSLELAEQIDVSVHRLDRVVSNILLFSKDELPQLAPVNAHAIIREQATQIEARHPEHEPIRLVLEGNPFVQANEDSLRQVIHNLLINAVQATRVSGDVSVVTSDGENAFLIEIRDGGRGISESVRDKLFEPFVTDKNEGTGLGLAIVKRIVNQHGGTVSVHNDNGAVFTISLPRTAVKAQ